MGDNELAIYGAVVSTVALGVTLWRAWADRRRLSTSYNLRSLDDLGNDVVLINHSPKPVTIYHPVLFWGRRVPWMRRYARTGIGDDDGIDTDTGTTIEPFKMAVLSYREERHFKWRHDARPGARLYIELSVVGRRRALTLFVYAPNSWSRGFWQRLRAILTGERDHGRRYLDEAPARKGDSRIS